MLQVSCESKDFLRNSFLNHFCSSARRSIGKYGRYGTPRSRGLCDGPSVQRAFLDTTAMHRYSANNRIEHQCYRVTASNLLAPSRSLV